MSVRQSNASSATTTMVPNAAAPAPMVDVTEASQETALAEGNNYNVVAQEAPLKRNVVVSILTSGELGKSHSWKMLTPAFSKNCVSQRQNGSTFGSSAPEPTPSNGSDGDVKKCNRYRSYLHFPPFF